MRTAAPQEIAQNLGEAIERLQEDISRVEMWAAALSCFAQPVPDYSPTDEYLLGSKVRPSRNGVNAQMFVLGSGGDY